MIEKLIIGIPRHVVPRDHIPSDELRKFENVTGIRRTRRYNGTSAEFIKETLEAHSRCCETSFDDVDCLIVVTQSPDRLSPCLAVDIHDFLELPSSVPAFDINHACDGFIMGLWAARALGLKPLVICVDRLRYNKTPLESLIFSDAVAIAKLEIDERSFPTKFYTDGSKANTLYCGLNGEMDMDGNKVFDFVTTMVPPLIAQFERENVPSDLLVPHQANRAMNKLLEMRSGFKGKTLYSIETFGNQSMCSIPTAIAFNERKALGKRLLLCGFGAGYTAALGRIFWPMDPVCRMVEV
jgi:3-oxoacyl-[acyl-carrier-protein] synthase III